MANLPLRDRIGTCPGCGGPLIKVVDEENRLWARCTSCGAQIPVEMFAKLKSGKKFCRLSQTEGLLFYCKSL